MRRILPTLIALCCATAPAVQAQDADADCGELRAQICPLLHYTREQWNERFGEEVQLQGFSYGGSATSSDLERLFSTESNSRALTLDPATDLPRIMTLGEMLKNTSDPDAAEATRARILRFREQFTEKMIFRWTGPEGEFETEALVSEQYPYLLDTMILSVIIPVQPEGVQRDAMLCFDVSLQLVNRIEIGRFIAMVYSDTTQSPTQGTSFSCSKSLYGYNNFGDIAWNSTEFLYTGDTCSTEIAYGFTTPLAGVEVGAAPLAVSFSGLGRTWKEERTCRLP